MAGTQTTSTVDFRLAVLLRQVTESLDCSGLTLQTVGSYWLSSCAKLNCAGLTQSVGDCWLSRRIQLSVVGSRWLFNCNRLTAVDCPGMAQLASVLLQCPEPRRGGGGGGWPCWLSLWPCYNRLLLAFRVHQFDGASLHWTQAACYSRLLLPTPPV